MIDFHSHILPAVDDGSRNLQQTLDMLDSLYQQGVETVVATPHFYADYHSVDEFVENRDKAYEQVMASLPNSAPKIVLGAEVKYYDGISHLDGLKKLALKDSRLLLLEMPFAPWTRSQIDEIINIVNRFNIVVVLAHIERYLKFQKKSVINFLVQSGVLLQCNASFFTTPFYRQKAFKMLKHGQIHFIGSDCHNMTTRPPLIKPAIDTIAKKFGNEFANNFVYYGNDLFLNNIIK